MSKLQGRSASAWLLPAVFLVAAVAAAPALAQTYRGAIRGTVSDSTGAVVPAAKIRVVNEATGLTHETQTSKDGSYYMAALPIGSYSVAVEMAGFQTSVTKNVQVDVAVELRVDVTLQTGDVSQRVEVSGETIAQIDTSSDVLGGSFQAQEILGLAPP